VYYNSCSDMSQLRRDITDSVADIGYNAHCLFSKGNVEEAVRRLKSGKIDGDMGFDNG